MENANLNYLLSNGWTQIVSQDANEVLLIHASLPKDLKLTLKQALRKQAQILLSSEKEASKIKKEKEEKSLSQQLEDKGWIFIDGLWYHYCDQLKIGVSDKNYALKLHSERKFPSIQISELEKSKLTFEIKYENSLKECLKLKEKYDELKNKLQNAEQEIQQLKNDAFKKDNFRSDFIKFVLDNFYASEINFD